VPSSIGGSGLPRTSEMLKHLHEIGHFVTFFPMTVQEETNGDGYPNIPPEIEIAGSWGRRRLRAFLRSREGFYDVILVSRPHNMQTLVRACGRETALYQRSALIYDAEALFSGRDRLARQLFRRYPSEWSEAREFRLAELADCVLTVSEKEAAQFRERGVRCTQILGHSILPQPTPATFDDRRDFLFVGPMKGHPTPNSDGILWFASQVWPTIRARLGDDLKLRVVGKVTVPEVLRLDGENIRIAGPVEDLTGLYDQSRVFVAPTRFAAGVPLKIYEAAAFGIPSVVTQLLASQLAWEDSQELLAEEHTRPEAFAARCVELYTNAELWNRVRDGALQRVGVDCAPETFGGNLQVAIEQALAFKEKSAGGR
jgi:glycosyltransferase involved in cell wall biosynthesis